MKSPSDGPDIKAIYDTWATGYQNADVDKIMSIYAPSAIFDDPCYAPKTYASLAAWFKFDFSRSGPRPTWKYEVESAESSGSLAFVISNWVGYTDFGKPQQAEVRRLRSVDFFRLGADGWKIFRTLNIPEACVGTDSKSPKKPKKPRKKK